MEPGERERSSEAVERHPEEADRDSQKGGGGLPDRLREGKGAYRPRLDVGRSWETEVEL